MPQTILASILTPPHSSKLPIWIGALKCPKPSWQALRPPPIRAMPLWTWRQFRGGFPKYWVVEVSAYTNFSYYSTQRVVLICLQGALGAGIAITNAGGAGFKAWEVIKVSSIAKDLRRWHCCAVAGEAGRVCARHPDQEVGHLRSSGHTGGHRKRWFAGDIMVMMVSSKPWCWQ